jgi:hypothetical protein
MTAEQVEYARDQVAENERLVAGWRELIARMQADGRDVTVARDLLKSFEDELVRRRSSHDVLQRMNAEATFLRVLNSPVR